MQIFPTNWNNFLAYYGKETNKEYGYVVLDFHPQTPNDKRIVKFYRTKVSVSNDENVSEQQKPYEKSEQNQQQNFWKQNSNKNNLSWNQNIYLQIKKKNMNFL